MHVIASFTNFISCFIWLYSIVLVCHAIEVFILRVWKFYVKWVMHHVLRKSTFCVLFSITYLRNHILCFINYTSSKVCLAIWWQFPIVNKIKCIFYYQNMETCVIFPILYRVYLVICLYIYVHVSLMRVFINGNDTWISRIYINV